MATKPGAAQTPSDDSGRELMQDKWGDSKWGGSGVLAGPGTPRGSKSHLFATKWVAVPPFGTLKPASGTEFRPGSRSGGPGAQIPTFCSPILDPKMPKSQFSRRVSFFEPTHRNGLGALGALGPLGPLGPLLALKGP